MKQSAVSSQQSAVAEKYFYRRSFSCFRRAVFFLFTAYCLLLTVFAQTEEPLDEIIAPPPLKVLSKTEKSQIAAVKNIKDHTRLALELMEVRLLNAEGFSTKEQYREMFDELGGFHALVDDTLDFLKRNNNDSSRVLNNFKRIELSLRKYITRLELIRRELPTKYERYVRELTKHIRDARTAAVEPLFNDSVVPLNKPE